MIEILYLDLKLLHGPDLEIWLFMWTKTIALYRRMVCAKFGWSWPSGYIIEIICKKYTPYTTHSKKNLNESYLWNIKCMSDTYLLGLLASGSVTNRRPWNEALLPYSCILLRSLWYLCLIIPGEFSAATLVFWPFGV